MQSIPVWEKVTVEQFKNEIVPQNKPVILKSLMGDWSVVKAAKESSRAFADYIKSHDRKKEVLALVGSPDIKGRFFYNKDLKNNNFIRKPVTLSVAVEHLMINIDKPNPNAIAVQAVQVREVLQKFDEENPQPLLDKSIPPTMWMGNQAMVAPHYDPYDNLAAVVAGRRKFTLFPPEQINNLYLGPLLNTPAGVPISMVNLLDPDFEQFPRFQQALDAGQEAVLEPGDAIYIPALWWHAVQSLDKVNMLVNYWWGGITDSGISPSQSILHSMLTIAKLSPEKRMAWRHFFDYHVFQIHDDPKAHLPEDLKDITTTLDRKQKIQLRDFLISSLK